MENKLAQIIGRVYRTYDDKPDVEQDEEMYFNMHRVMFERMATEYSMTPVTDHESCAKNLLRGSMLGVSDLPVYDEEFDLHWERWGSDWIDMDAEIRRLMV